MKSFLTIFFVLISSNLFSQHFPDYQVINNPIPIQESPYGKVIIRVPKKKFITNLSYDKKLDCFKGQYKKVYGAINTVWLSPLYVPIKDSMNRRDEFLKDSLDNVRNTEARIKRENEMKVKYDLVTANKILQREIWLDMTDNMAIDSWGKPDKINRSVGSWGVHEQWVYGDTYLYFEDGILTSWQD
jgi:hypothetical protein